MRNKCLFALGVVFAMSLTSIVAFALLKPNHANMIGSYLYKFDEHKIPIAGNILFVGEEWTRDWIDFCGIEDETFKLLHLELKNMVMAMKATKEAMNL